MSDFDWKKLGPDYKTVNANLNGLPDYIRGTGIKQPEEVDPYKPKDKSFADKLLTFIGNVPRAATFGLTDTMLKKLQPRTMKAIEEESARNPGAALLGNIGGVAATLPLEIGAGIGRGVQAGVSAIKGVPKIAGAVAGGAAAAAPTAILQAANEYAKTKSIGKAAKNLGASLLFGGAGGAITGAIASKLPKAQKATREALNDLVLQAGGVRGRSLQQTLQGGIAGKAGFTPQRAEQLKDEIASTIAKKGLFGKQSIAEFIDDGGAIWKKIDDAWDKSGLTVDSFRQKVMNDPEVMDLLTMPGIDPDSGIAYADYAKKTLEDVFSRTSAKKGLPAIRAELMKNMKNAWSKQDTLHNIVGDINGSLRDAIDMQFVPVELKAEYPALLTLKKSLAWAESQVARNTGGSATAPRAGLKKMLEGAAGGAGMGALGASKEFDPKDPSTWGRSAAILGASTLGGAALNRLLAKAQTQGLGRAAGALRNVVPTEISPAISKIAAAAPQIGSKVAQGIGTAGGLTGTQEGTPVEASVTQAETVAGPEAVTQAREKVNTAYKDKVLSALQNDWVNTFAQYAQPLGIDYDGFVQLVSSVTEGFDDPKKTAKILFHDPAEREKFLRDYDAALKWQTQDIEGALGYVQPTGVLGMGGHPVEQQAAYQNLIDYLGGTYNQGKGANESERKRIEALIMNIAKSNKTPEEKKAMIQKMLADYGIDFNQLASLGLYGGTNV